MGSFSKIKAILETAQSQYPAAKTLLIESKNYVPPSPLPPSHTHLLSPLCVQEQRLLEFYLTFANDFPTNDIPALFQKEILAKMAKLPPRLLLVKFVHIKSMPGSADIREAGFWSEKFTYCKHVNQKAITEARKART